MDGWAWRWMQAWCRNRNGKMQYKQQASKQDRQHRSAGEDRNYKKVCFTGPPTIISIGPETGHFLGVKVRWRGDKK